MTEYAQMCCGECGIEFQVPNHFYRERLETGRGWYCPNGHSRVFKESKVDKLQRELNNAKQQIARAEDEAREAREESAAQVKLRKRLEKRVHNGVCPCCSRSFANLKRHMATKHPSVTPLRSA